MILGILIPNTDDADNSGSEDLYDDGNCDDETKVTHSVADIAISGVENFMGNKNRQKKCATETCQSLSQVYEGNIRLCNT